MKKSRFTEVQIVAILKELEAGTPATELARRHGVHANTIRLWKDKYAASKPASWCDSSSSRKRAGAKTASSRGKRSNSMQ